MGMNPNISVVLVSPKEPGNIGSTARAMLNMGVSDLRLVNPRCNPMANEAVWMAVHAKEVLLGASIFETLEDAIADCHCVIGTTARDRGLDFPAAQTPRALSTQIPASGTTCIVFGREESGLTTEELARCQTTVKIPTSEYSSLNLSQAVLIVLYEFFQAESAQMSSPEPELPSSREAMERFYNQLENLVLEIGYTDPPRLPHVMQRYRKIFDRAKLSSDEVRMVQGLLSQMAWIAKGNRPKR